MRPRGSDLDRPGSRAGQGRSVGPSGRLRWPGVGGPRGGYRLTAGQRRPQVDTAKAESSAAHM